MTTECTILIDPSGSTRFVWDDELADVAEALGQVRIDRASHVEPTADGQWAADMGPSGGPVLLAVRLRSDALAAERKWLSENRGL